PQAIDVNPLAQTLTTPTPYGNITVTRPEGAPTLQNPLAQEGTLQMAAEAYRNAPPEQRGQAMANYAKALEAKAQAARVAGGAPADRASRPAFENGAITMAQAFGKPAFGGGEWPGRPDTVAQLRENRVVEL